MDVKIKYTLFKDLNIGDVFKYGEYCMKIDNDRAFNLEQNHLYSQISPDRRVLKLNATIVVEDK